MSRYTLLSVVFGALWFFVYLIPDSGRGLLIQSNTAWIPYFMALVISSYIFAVIFKKLILNRKIHNLILGITLPYIGSILFAVLAGFFCNIYGWILPSRENLVLMIWIPYGALIYFYITIPMGIGIQYTMRWAGESEL